MKAKIDKDGNLWIERKAGWKLQYCPFGSPGGQYGPARCGDWCPLFEEDTDSVTHHSFVALSCSHNSTRYEVVSDERAG